MQLWIPGNLPLWLERTHWTVHQVFFFLSWMLLIYGSGARITRQHLPLPCSCDLWSVMVQSRVSRVELATNGRSLQPKSDAATRLLLPSHMQSSRLSALVKRKTTPGGTFLLGSLLKLTLSCFFAQSNGSQLSVVLCDFGWRLRQCAMRTTDLPLYLIQSNIWLVMQPAT